MHSDVPVLFPQKLQSCRYRRVDAMAGLKKIKNLRFFVVTNNINPGCVLSPVERGIPIKNWRLTEIKNLNNVRCGGHQSFKHVIGEKMIAELKKDEIAMVSGAGFWNFVFDFGKAVTPFNPLENFANSFNEYTTKPTFKKV